VGLNVSTMDGSCTVAKRYCIAFAHGKLTAASKTSDMYEIEDKSKMSYSGYSPDSEFAPSTLFRQFE